MVFAAYDFASSAACCQLVDGPTHIAGGTLDLVLTDIPDLVKVVVGSPVGTSDHSALLMELSLNQTVPHSDIRREVYLEKFC